jgi:diguanylate cyclase (GGDEF)-like protein/PAS domain S-box-containing protein
VVLLEDVTQERAAVAARTELAALIAVLEEAVYSLDAEGRLRSWNSAAERLFGWRHDEALGQHVITLAPADRQTEQRAWLARLAEGESVRADTVRLRSDGTPVDVSLTITPVLDASGRLSAAIWIAHDIGERKQAIDRLRYLARHDPVTGLANRRWFTERLHDGLERFRAGAGQVGVLFIDLDRFKEVNDRYGHGVGDQYLRVIGARMLAALRPSDLLARWGGDEYAVLVEHLADRTTLLSIADRLQRALSGPVRVGDASLPVTASIGVAASGPDINDDQLLQAADAAMYTATNLGGARTATAWHRTMS